MQASRKDEKIHFSCARQAKFGGVSIKCQLLCALIPQYLSAKTSHACLALACLSPRCQPVPSCWLRALSLDHYGLTNGRVTRSVPQSSPWRYHTFVLVRIAFAIPRPQPPRLCSDACKTDMNLVPYSSSSHCLQYRCDDPVMPRYRCKMSFFRQERQKALTRLQMYLFS